MLRASLPATIDLRLHDESDGTAVLGDGTQLQQVLFNLCTNAAHAIGPAAGSIEIGLSRVDITTPFDTQVGKLQPGTYLRLRVADTGCGMDQAMKARIFDPFYTTKEVGQGTGLGLSIVHNTLLAHHGAIVVRSSPDHGSTFTLYLPVATTPPAEAPAIVNDTDQPHPQGRGQRIAIIDDDASILELNRMALQQAGYVPVVYVYAEDCLKAFLANPVVADLIVTDQTMPGMTGLELVQSLRKVGEKVPIVIASGYNRLITPELLGQLGNTAFLAKPFTIDTLLAKVAHLLPA